MFNIDNFDEKELKEVEVDTGKISLNTLVDFQEHIGHNLTLAKSTFKVELICKDCGKKLLELEEYNSLEIIDIAGYQTSLLYNREMVKRNYFGVSLEVRDEKRGYGEGLEFVDVEIDSKQNQLKGINIWANREKAEYTSNLSQQEKKETIQYLIDNYNKLSKIFEGAYFEDLLVDVEVLKEVKNYL